MILLVWSFRGCGGAARWGGGGQSPIYINWVGSAGDKTEGRLSFLSTCGERWTERERENGWGREWEWCIPYKPAMGWSLSATYLTWVEGNAEVSTPKTESHASENIVCPRTVLVLELVTTSCNIFHYYSKRILWE